VVVVADAAHTGNDVIKSALGVVRRNAGLRHE
jgi:hypothetical protein